MGRLGVPVPALLSENRVDRPHIGGPRSSASHCRPGSSRAAVRARIAFACGMASTFKYIGDEFPDNMGVVSGIVGMAGGLGGFLLPIMFGVILDWLGVNSSCFMLLYGIVGVSLTLNYLTESASCAGDGRGPSGPRTASPDSKGKGQS